MKFLSRKILVFLLSLLLLTPSTSFLAVKPVHASGVGVGLFCDFLASPLGPGGNIVGLLTRNNEWYNQSICQFTHKVFNQNNPDEIFGERYTYAQVTWIINSLANYMFNTIFGAISPLLASNPSENHLAQQGLSGAMGSTFAFMQTNQISFIGSLTGFLKKFDPALSVHAQTNGFGYSTLQVNIQAFWTISRNASYLLMIILLIAAGFMVMFKVRINPQTAVTIQLMIPKIIISLIGITFSFAIAGLVIDLVYVSLSFLLTLIFTMDTHSPKFIVNLPQTITFFTSGNFGNLWSYYNTVSMGVSLPLSFLLPGGAIIFPILFAILLFRVLIAVARAYVMLLIHIVTGPFQIMAGLIPTSQSGFGSWLRNVIAHAAVFLVVPLLFFISMLFLAAGPGGGFFTTIAHFLPASNSPQLNGFDSNYLPRLPLFGGSDAIFGGSILAAILGYVILLLIPSTIDQTIKAFKAFSLGGIGDLDIPLGLAALTASNASQQYRQIPGVSNAVDTVQGAVRSIPGRVANPFRGRGGPPTTPSGQNLGS